MAKQAASFPVAGWVKHYNKQSFLSDLVAAVIVAIMLIPQSLAYAMLAGLPPEICLYASIVLCLSVFVLLCIRGLFGRGGARPEAQRI